LRLPRCRRVQLVVRFVARPRRVALFVTCLVDLFRPSVGFAAIKLLEDAGCTVEVPPLQVCCGQPAYNSGDRATTRAIAAQVIEAFEGFEAVVAPSGSCGGMLAHHYPRTVRRRSRDEGESREPRRPQPRAGVFPGRRAGREERRRAL
jgi:Fe-S oxidoreductase